MRILFTPAYSGSVVGHSKYLFRSSLPLETFDTVAGIAKDNAWITPNNGNLLHAESAAKIFSCDRRLSTVGQLPKLRTEDSEEETAKKLQPIEQSFDAIVLNFANIIHSKEHTKEGYMRTLEASFASLATVLERIRRVKIYALGIGLQDEVAPRRDAIGAQLYRLLRVLNKRASLLATRGHTTEKFLHDLGFSKAVALGCPSLFVNPTATANLAPRPMANGYLVTTAGRLSVAGLRKNRIQPLLALAQPLNPDYAFQNDLFNFFDKDELPDVPYNSESHEVGKSACDEKMRRIFKISDVFNRYYYFRTPQAWRAYAATRDAYVGDRFHGGVAFLQVGRPAAFIYGDVRVHELTGYFSLPSFTPGEVEALGAEGTIEKVTSPQAASLFRDTYLDRFARLHKVCREAGLVPKVALESLKAA